MYRMSLALNRILRSNDYFMESGVDVPRDNSSGYMNLLASIVTTLCRHVYSES
ncbi:hypothetical protein BH10CHL1_BH10CHL1_35380 [soil metagenome]